MGVYWIQVLPKYLLISLFHWLDPVRIWQTATALPPQSGVSIKIIFRSLFSSECLAAYNCGVRRPMLLCADKLTSMDQRIANSWASTVVVALSSILRADLIGEYYAGGRGIRGLRTGPEAGLRHDGNRCEVVCCLFMAALFGVGGFVSMSCILHPLVWQGRHSYI